MSAVVVSDCIPIPLCVSLNVTTSNKIRFLIQEGLPNDSEYRREEGIRENIIISSYILTSHDSHDILE